MVPEGELMATLIGMPSEFSDLTSLFKSVDSEDPAREDVRALRKALEERPGLWKVAGDLSRLAAITLASSLPDNKTVDLSMSQGWEALQEELGASTASPLEQLLIQQVVLSWMRLSYVELHYSALDDQGVSMEQRKYWEGRLNAAQRRFLRACETLARIRKIDRHLIQLNIAEKQVNVAG